MVVVIMCDMLRWGRTFEERIAKVIPSGIVLKADGIVTFAVELIVNLNAIPLSNLHRNTPVREIFQKIGSGQTRYPDILKCWLFLKLLWLKGLSEEVNNGGSFWT